VWESGDVPGNLSLVVPLQIHCSQVVRGTDGSY
jgi:hypothetical protein